MGGAPCLFKEPERSEVLFLPRSEAERHGISKRYPQPGDANYKKNLSLLLIGGPFRQVKRGQTGPFRQIRGDRFVR